MYSMHAIYHTPSSLLRTAYYMAGNKASNSGVRFSVDQKIFHILVNDMELFFFEGLFLLSFRLHWSERSSWFTTKLYRRQYDFHQKKIVHNGLATIWFQKIHITMNISHFHFNRWATPFTWLDSPALHWILYISFSKQIHFSH